MKISGVNVYQVKGRGWPKYAWIWVEVHTDEGITGIGEAAPVDGVVDALGVEAGTPQLRHARRDLGGGEARCATQLLRHGRHRRELLLRGVGDRADGGHLIFEARELLRRPGDRGRGDHADPQELLPHRIDLPPPTLDLSLGERQTPPQLGPIGPQFHVGTARSNAPGSRHFLALICPQTRASSGGCCLS